MIEVLLTLCLAADPQKCHDERLNFEGETISLFSCATYGQFAIAEHMQLRPRWRVDRWKCQYPGQTAKI